ncbi:ParB N-terminal domain-containing protein [Bacillus haynesii]|uniref:ParB N-terminal domain-containing protein n=1 Tax=Bacillus TaxID=1386 RepID=UPI002282046E|nr:MULTISPECIES: ParB N-terminal domain-containing protein [Bacillus]MCY8178847.1 ParB N-terminal domain-containing protein [Bacillus paralicheniformis]MCY8242628.1 ParB N-terminal domain-containing protein [Bacillus haynesii]MEC1474048.1 ParB N-terminal domain-containing protein [Bacillus haynesii]MEC1485120.1 ParB N-terminal domain-containing protein [Bacillus haynesii]
MIIKSIPIEKINPAAYNPRIDLQPGDPEYEALKQSMKRFGAVEPLVWNEKTGNLVGGHQRFKIHMEEKPRILQVSVVNLDESEEKALNLALNKISGDWDDYKLEQVLEDLQHNDFDLSLTGFSENEIDEILGELAEHEGNGGKINDSQELDLDDYEDDHFQHTCPKCGFSFNE